MEETQKHPDPNVNDKYKGERGRKAANKGEDSKFLNDDSLDDDLIDLDKRPTRKGDAGIVSSEHPENQEWNAREDQNKDT